MRILKKGDDLMQINLQNSKSVDGMQLSLDSWPCKEMFLAFETATNTNKIFFKGLHAKIRKWCAALIVFLQHCQNI